jgi:hypothetical protein
MATRMTLLALAFGVSACAAPTDPGRPDLEGAWSGSVEQPEVHLELTLTRRTGGLAPAGFEGSGTLWGAGPRVDLVVSGTALGDSVSLMLEPPGYVPIRFDGAVSQDALRLAGTLDGSGIQALPIVLARTP